MTRVALRALVVLSALVAAPLAGWSSGLHQIVPSEFNARVERYIELHHAVAESLAPEPLQATPERQRRFAAALRQARPFARSGNIFTLEVAEFFKTRLTEVVGESRIDVAAALTAQEEPDEEGFYELPLLEVNGAFPWSASHTWPSLLRRLPPLPLELEYRFVGTSLLIVDVRAGLIVDLLEAALPVNDGYPPAPRQLGPCDVHPDLPACWI